MGRMDEMDEMDDDAPSFGETRAADIPTTQNRYRSTSSAPASPTPYFEQTVDMPRNTSLPPRTTRTVSTDTQSGTSRYCGTCGARIERGEVFCGQCGMPVSGVSGNNQGGRSSVSGAPSRYVVGDDDVWSPGQGNDLTEAFVPSPPTNMPAPYNRGVASAPYAPYNQGYGTPGSYPGYATPQDGSARTTRIVWGVVCLVASLITAVVAIVLVVAR